MAVFEAKTYWATSDGAVLWAVVRARFGAVGADVFGATPLDMALLTTQATAIVCVLFSGGVRCRRGVCAAARWYLGLPDGTACGGNEGSSWN